MDPPQAGEDEEAGEKQHDDDHNGGDGGGCVDLNTGAGRHVVVLVAGGTEVPGVRAGAGAGGGGPGAAPGQTLGSLVLVVTQTGAGGPVVVLEVRHTLLPPLHTPALTLLGRLHLDVAAQGLVLPHVPSGHRHHHLQGGFALHLSVCDCDRASWFIQIPTPNLIPITFIPSLLSVQLWFV